MNDAGLALRADLITPPIDPDESTRRHLQRESPTKAIMEETLSVFPSASAELLASRALLRRTDSKHVVHTSTLDSLVSSLRSDYALLRVPTGNVATYQSLYLDTKDLQCFHDHRRGRRVRHKVRFRHYPDRELSFLEVKAKRNEFLTEKHRLAVSYRCEEVGEREGSFLHARLGASAAALAPVSYVCYQRAILVGAHTTERVTIDFDIEATDLDGVRRPLGSIAVIEVKQQKFSLATPVMRVLRAGKVRSGRMSKYVVAVSLAYPQERRNRLLPSLRALAAMSASGATS